MGSHTRRQQGRRRPPKMCRKARIPDENAPVGILDCIPKSELEEKLSEISDFVNLDDVVLSDLEYFDGVDCASSPSVMKVKSGRSGGGSTRRKSKPGSRRRKRRSRALEKKVRSVAGARHEIQTLSVPEALKEPTSPDRTALKEPQKNVCPLCQKSFKQLGHLRSHYYLHTGERPFVCEICGKRFAQSGHLISHVNSHTSNRPYVCSFCDKRFTQSGHKRNHERSHLGIRPYECMLCHKRFTQSGHLVNHLRLHDGDKPYECEICGKSFTQSGHLRSHSKTHMK